MSNFFPRQARRADDEPDLAPDKWPVTQTDARPPPPDSGEMPIEEEPIAYSSLSTAIKKSVEEHLPGASGHDAVRMQLGEVVLYHIVAQRGRTGLAITVSPAGEVIELERDVAPSRVPKAVKQALAAYYPNTFFSSAGVITMHFYEFEYEDDQHNRRVVQIDASGRVLQDVDEENA
ncbi:MAG: hypothetical protein ACR2IE_20050 [Candidatus Sumerlaeaceae bacterium]